MKTAIIAFLSATIITSVSFADTNKIIATFKGREIKESELTEKYGAIWEKEETLKGKKFNELPCAIQESIATLAVRTELIKEEVKAKNYRNTEDFKKRIEETIVRLEQENLIQDILKNVKIDEAKIKADYDEYIANNKGKKERQVAHIVVADQETAKKAKSSISKKKSFGDVAKEYSQDKATKDVGGVIGFISKGQGLPKDFEDKIFSLKIDEVSEPIKTDAGYHIIKVLKENIFPEPTFEQAKPMLEGRVKNAALEAYFNELAKKVDLKITLDCKKAEEQKK